MGPKVQLRVNYPVVDLGENLPVRPGEMVNLQGPVGRVWRDRSPILRKTKPAMHDEFWTKKPRPEKPVMTCREDSSGSESNSTICYAWSDRQEMASYGKTGFQSEPRMPHQPCKVKPKSKNPPKSSQPRRKNDTVCYSSTGWHFVPRLNRAAMKPKKKTSAFQSSPVWVKYDLDLTDSSSMAESISDEKSTEESWWPSISWSSEGSLIELKSPEDTRLSDVQQSLFTEDTRLPGCSGSCVRNPSSLSASSQKRDETCHNATSEASCSGFEELRGISKKNQENLHKNAPEGSDGTSEALCSGFEELRGISKKNQENLHKNPPDGGNGTSEALCSGFEELRGISKKNQENLHKNGPDGSDGAVRSQATQTKHTSGSARAVSTEEEGASHIGTWTARPRGRPKKCRHREKIKVPMTAMQLGSGETTDTASETEFHVEGKTPVGNGNWTAVKARKSRPSMAEQESKPQHETKVSEERKPWK